MNFKYALFALGLVPSIMFANNDCVKRYGITHCGNVVIEKFYTNGMATLDGTTVKNHTEINGTLEASDVKLNTLKVNGTAKLRNAEIAGRTEINGTLEASKARFNSPVYINANVSQLSGCLVQEIYMGNETSAQPKLFLRGTIASGNISFTKNKGIVHICEGAKISGQVNNGTILEHC